MRSRRAVAWLQQGTGRCDSPWKPLKTPALAIKPSSPKSPRRLEGPLRGVRKIMRGKGFAPGKRRVLASLLAGNQSLRGAVKPGWGSALPRTFVFRSSLPFQVFLDKNPHFTYYSFQPLVHTLSPCPQGVSPWLCPVGREENGAFPSAAIQAGCR